MKKVRILYIGPMEDPNYHNAFILELEKVAHVDYFPFFVQAYFTNPFIKAGLWHTAEIAKQKHYDKLLLYNNYDYILVRFGFQIKDEIYTKLRINNPSAKFVNFHWDSLKERYNYLPIMKHFDRIISFDIQDCKNNPTIEYLPLFYLNEYATLQGRQIISKPDIDLLFIGAWRSKERYELTMKTKHLCKKNGLVFRYYLYVRPIDFFYSLYKGKYIKEAKLRMLSPKKIIKLFSKSRAIIDFSNSFQSGYTMRTIETLGAGKKLITTNRNIVNEPFYDKNIISVISPEELNMDIDFIKNEDEVKLISNIDDFSIRSYVKKLLL